MDNLRRLAAAGARWAFLALVVMASVLTLFFAVTPQGRTAFKTAVFVAQVLEIPVGTQTWLSEQPVREAVAYPQPSGQGVADIYRVPGGASKAGVLLFLGANAAGRDDEDVVNLGNALARAGFAAMFHWSPTMALRHNMDAAEVQNLVWAFRYLRSLDYIDGQRVGLGGFCVGASFALVAAADPAISGDVRFISAFGPYFDAEDLLFQVATGSRYGDEGSTPWVPDPLTLKVMANELIETLDDTGDAEALTRIHMGNGEASDAEVSGLTSDGLAVHRLLTGVSPEEAEKLYSGLPEDFKAGMRSVSPRYYLPGLTARVSVLHDRDDELVPATESRRLASAMAEREGFRYTEVQSFDHVRAGDGGGAWEKITDGFRLYRHMYSLIRETE